MNPIQKTISLNLNPNIKPKGCQNPWKHAEKYEKYWVIQISERRSYLRLIIYSQHDFRYPYRLQGFDLREETEIRDDESADETIRDDEENIDDEGKWSDQREEKKQKERRMKNSKIFIDEEKNIISDQIKSNSNQIRE